MLPPLQPEYNDDGDLVEPFLFNAAMMREVSGDPAALAPHDLQATNAIVRTVLFPVVVKKGDDAGVGDEDTVVCLAEVLVARDGGRNRPASGVSPMAASPSSFGGGGGGGGVSTAAAQASPGPAPSDVGGVGLASFVE
jgi:hypothetical protein